MPNDLSALRSLMDAVVPADRFPSAAESGVLHLLEQASARERPDWPARFAHVLDLVQRIVPDFTDAPAETQQRALAQVADEPDVAWFCRLVQLAYYADPGGSGSSSGPAMLHWAREPAGGWPSPLLEDEQVPEVGWSAIRPRYDVVVVGSGAGGSVAADRLTESGRSVLLVEWGRSSSTRELAHDHLRNARTVTGLVPRTAADDPRTTGLDERTLVEPWEPAWGGNAHVLGGGTRVYGAQAWRFVPADFAMASTYGRPDGSSLADWPITYDDLESHYGEAERLLGVSGSSEDAQRLAPRSSSYPMGPLPSTRAADRLEMGARALGLSLSRVPLAVNSTTYHGRPACARCSQCVGFTCPIGAKNDAANTFLARAASTGRLQVLTATRVTRVRTDSTGRVDGVVLARPGAELEVAAGDVVLSAGAVETARLLLLSASDRYPDGLGNQHDQVGRHLQGHLYGGALGIVPDAVNDFRGPGPVWSTHDYRHGNQGLVGGGMLANEFTPTPADTYAYLLDAGLVGRHGVEVKGAMRDLMPRMQRVVGPVQEVTTASSRVRLSRTVMDRLGTPVAHLEGRPHANDLAVQGLLGERAAAWLEASGAVRVVQSPLGPFDRPSSGQHQAGTCRMGADPASSVTDPEGRVWGHDNLRIIDASLHVTNGGVNPFLTVIANALRILDGWVG